MIFILEKILNPDLYHGEGVKGDFFEGWYFKVSDKEGKNVFSIIPGIYKGKDEEASHSFIQILDGNKVKYNYVRFRRDDFNYLKNSFHIFIKGNVFSLDGINLNIKNDGIDVKGHLRFKDVIKWPGTIINPGSMGFYNYLSFMECYSQVSALDGKVDGYIKIDDKEFDFNGGKIYIEKNWGKKFPQSWIWVQSNNFDNGDVAFTCSIGRVPFLFGSFSGFLVGFILNGEFYKFTTMNRSKMEILRNGRDVVLSFINGNISLNVKTKSNEEDFMLCYGPTDDGMVPLVNEALNGVIEVELREKGELLYKGIGYATGIEYGGDESQL